MSSAQPTLLGRRVLITAGPTYEALDPVRFIGNRSSGKMGFALAQEAASRGAAVTLVAGPVHLPTPPGVHRIDVESAAEMAAAVLPAASAAKNSPEVIVMCAAVADYRPAARAPQKLKKHALGSTLTVELVPTVDILAELGRTRQSSGQTSRPLLIGFAAETTDVEAYARRKLREKRCDVIVANDVSAPDSGFAVDTNRVTLYFAHGAQLPLPLLTKQQTASRIWDAVTDLLATSQPPA